MAYPRHPQAIGLPLALADQTGGGVFSVACSPRGQILASSSSDGSIRLWHLSLSYAVQRICATAGNILTARQWRESVPQVRYQPPCAGRTFRWG
jgi:WD40 repeat protein